MSMKESDIEKEMVRLFEDAEKISEDLTHRFQYHQGRQDTLKHLLSLSNMN